MKNHWNVTAAWLTIAIVVQILHPVTSSTESSSYESGSVSISQSVEETASIEILQHDDDNDQDRTRNSSIQKTNIEKFNDWLKRYNKLDTSIVAAAGLTTTNDIGYSYEQRLKIFTKNVEHVMKHNVAFENGWTMYRKSDDGPFMDMTDEEFTTSYLMEPQDCSATSSSSGRLRPSNLQKTKKDDHPHIDWRTKGIMTPVKNQGHCGSCWTFSTTGCLESHICLAAGKDCTDWTGLSEEQLVECAGDFNNFGCSGGLPSQAYEYLKYNGGLMTEVDYPYTAPSNDGKSKCSIESKTQSGNKWRAHVTEVFNITTRDEDDLQHAVAEIGPVSIAYQVSPDFRFYQHGIYDSYNVTTNKTMCHDGTHDVNHAVVAVGLGTSYSVKLPDNTTSDVDYYIVRNSWSADWGMEGHFWIKRGENLCGLADCASFPIVPAVEYDHVSYSNNERDGSSMLDETKSVNSNLRGHDRDVLPQRE